MEKVIYINLCFRLMIMKRNGFLFTLHCCCHRHRRCTSMIHNTRKYWNERTNETRAQDVPFWECEFFWWMKRNEIKFESHNKLGEKYKKNSADEQWSSFSSRSKIYEFMLGCHQKQRSIENVSSIQIRAIHLCAIFLHFPRYVVTAITSCPLTMSTRKLWKFTSSRWVHKCEFN